MSFGQHMLLDVRFADQDCCPVDSERLRASRPDFDRPDQQLHRQLRVWQRRRADWCACARTVRDGAGQRVAGKAVKPYSWQPQD